MFRKKQAGFCPSSNTLDVVNHRRLTDSTRLGSALGSEKRQNGRSSQLWLIVASRPIPTCVQTNIAIPGFGEGFGAIPFGNRRLGVITGVPPAIAYGTRRMRGWLGVLAGQRIDPTEATHPRPV